MPSLRNSLASLTDYRIGYSPQRPYPWRWTTPLALFILLTSAALLACLNIPLSAYETVQEFTYFPNATVAVLPLNNIIPSFLRAPTASFAPQTMHVGDTFRLNNSLFSYTIVSAFDSPNGASNKKLVSSFPYYNNPFSNNCDVTNITAKVTRTLGESIVPYQYYDYTASGFVTCTKPTMFQMTWGLPMVNDQLFWPTVDKFGLDLREALYYGLLGGAEDENLYGAASVEVTARPCCNCTGTIKTTSDAAMEAEFVNLLEPPCSTEPARFIGLSGLVVNSTAMVFPWGFGYNWNGSNITDLFAGLQDDIRQGYIGSNDLSALNIPFQNLFQILYHLVRSDLGNFLGNQIYSSPEMFNRSIATIAVPPELLGYGGSPFGNITTSAANRFRAEFSNSTFMAHWQNSSFIFSETDRVPVLEYLRPVPRLKPLGSAITSVFVSTFAMVSTVWTIFSIVARAFVRPSNDPGTSAARETFNVPVYQAIAKQSFEEETEATEVYSLVPKDPVDTDDRLNILREQVAALIERMDRMEKNNSRA